MCAGSNAVMEGFFCLKTLTSIAKYPMGLGMVGAVWNMRAARKFLRLLICSLGIRMAFLVEEGNIHWEFCPRAF